MKENGEKTKTGRLGLLLFAFLCFVRRSSLAAFAFLPPCPSGSLRAVTRAALAAAAPPRPGAGLGAVVALLLLMLRLLLLRRLRWKRRRPRRRPAGGRRAPAGSSCGVLFFCLCFVSFWRVEERHKWRRHLLHASTGMYVRITHRCRSRQCASAPCRHASYVE